MGTANMVRHLLPFISVLVTGVELSMVMAFGSGLGLSWGRDWALSIVVVVYLPHPGCGAEP